LINPARNGPDNIERAIGVLTVDTSLRVRTWSDWLELVTGITASTAQGRPLAEILPDLERRGLLAVFSRVIETGQAQVLAPAFHHYLVACPPRRPSAHFQFMQQLVTLGPLREEERIAGVMATIEDVTERLEAERTLAEDLRSVDPAVRNRALERVEAAGAAGPHAAIVELLRNDSWQVRRGAIDGLSRQTPARLVASLIEALRDEHRDFNVLSSALQLLSMIDVDVTTPLSELLKTGEADLRMQAALALGEQSSPTASAALVEALDDPDPNVRFHVIESLGKLRVAEAVDSLAEIAESRDFFLAFPAIDALARIDDPRIGSRLRRLLDDDTLSAPVVEALGRLGDGDVTRALVAVLNRSEAPVGSVAGAIANLYDEYEGRYEGGLYIVSEFQASLNATGAQNLLDALSDGRISDLRPVVLLLGWIQSPAVARALAQLLGHPACRADVIEALVRHGAGVVDELIDRLGAEDEQVQLAAVSALGKLGDRRSTAPIASLLTADRTVVIAAAAALASIGDPAAFRPLLGLLGHADATVRQAAISALNALGHPDMESSIAPLLTDADPRVRESAVRIAGYFGYPGCADAMFERCRDEVEAVRRAALEHVALIDEARALPVLLGAISTETPRVRAGVAIALGGIVQAESRAALRRALSDRDGWVRYFAARSLGEHGAADALDDLAEVAAHDLAPHVRIAALEAIGAIDGPRAAELLARHAEDSDAEIAAAAVTSLGRVADGAAAATLARALRSPDPARRLSAITAFSLRGGPDGVASLQWTAEADAIRDVALAAIGGLARLATGTGEGWELAVDALVELTADPKQQDAALVALARLPAGRAERVAKGVSHPIGRVRRKTIEALTRMKDPDAAARLRGALDDADAGVREAAVIALKRIGARGLVGKLSVMSESDPDSAVRRAAAAATSRQPDPGSEGGAGG
jgi:HEAT repeat protein